MKIQTMRYTFCISIIAALTLTSISTAQTVDTIAPDPPEVLSQITPEGAVATQAATTDSWGGKTVAQWTERLADPDRRVRWYAVYALGKIGPASASSVEQLAALIADFKQYEYVRGGAAWALGRIGPRSAAAVPVLTDSLGSTLLSVRRNAALALGHIGEAAKPAVARLTEVLQDKDAEVRINAAASLWRIEQNPGAMHVLLTYVAHTEGAGPFLAAKALGTLDGAPRETVVPALVTALGHPQSDVRRAAARSLGQIGADSLAGLRGAMQNSDVTIRLTAIEALGWIGAAGIDDLAAALKDTDARVRLRAAREIGRNAKSAGSTAVNDALVDATADADLRVRDEAVRALRLIRESNP